MNALAFINLAAGQDSLQNNVIVDHDSLLIVNSHLSRVGINTFVYQNTILGRIVLGEKHKTGFHFSNYWMYNQALKDNRYIKKDNIANLHYQFLIKDNIALIQELNVNDFGANNVRIIDISSNLKMSKQIISRNKEGKGISTHFFINQLKLGFLSDQRNEINDIGPVYGIDIKYLFTNPNKSFTSGLDMFYNRAEIFPRRNRIARISGSLNKIFNPYAYLNLNLGYTSRLKEDYFLDNIRQIVSDTIISKLDISYKITPSLILKSNNTIKLPGRFFNYRNINVDSLSTKQNIFYKQNNIDVSQKMIYTGKKLNTSLELNYKQRIRIYGLENSLDLDTIEFKKALEKEKIKDIKEATTTWNYSLNYRFNDKHYVSLNTISQLLRVDTPSDENDQDKDELLYNAEIAYITNWNKQFRTELKISGGFKHMVFIKAGQSTENFQERFLRYEPGFKWTTGKFRWNGNYNLWVTYQVRDFASQQNNNRSNRIFLMTHLMNYNLTNSTSFELEFLRRENRIGWLNWEAFTESPIDTTIIYDISISIKKVLFPANKNNSCAIELGYRYFDQNKRNKAVLNTSETIIKPDTTYIREIEWLIYPHNITLQHGPEVKFHFNNVKNLNIEFGIWFQFTRNFYRYTKGNQLEPPDPHPVQSFKEEDLQENKKEWFLYFIPYHKIYPYFTIKFNYNL